MTNVGTTRTQEQLWHDTLLHSHHPKSVRYHGKIIGGGFPGGTEVFINGEQDNRLYLPENCILAGTFIGVSWSLTNSTETFYRAFFSVRNNSGTVEAHPANFGGAGANPNVQFNEPASAIGWSLVFDNTLKALVAKFTPGVGDTHKATGVIDYVVAGEFTSFSNTLTVVDNG